ncbi:MAG: hypothetical protein V3V92_06060 [Candidatus Hydrothermarchaeales archaeon]
MEIPSCPKGHGSMELKRMEKATTFRGVDVSFEAEAYVCPQCGLEAGTVQSAGAVQRAISDAYRKEFNLSGKGDAGSETS